VQNIFSSLSDLSLYGMKMLIGPSLFGVMICFEKLMTTRNERRQRQILQKKEKKEKKRYFAHR
jgi:hypothetical protein